MLQLADPLLLMHPADWLMQRLREVVVKSRDTLFVLQL